MKKLKLFIAGAALILGGAIPVSAQTDVTSTYLTNPGFESSSQRFLDINTDRGAEKPLGWSVEWYQDNSDKNGMTFVAESMTQDSKTWNAKSNKSYFARMRWGNATLYLRQTLQNLRPGDYTLTFSATAHSTNVNNLVQVTVAGQTQSIASGTVTNEDGTWTDYSINFSVTANSPYATIEFKASRAGDLLKVGIDEFALTYDGSSYYATILEKAQTIYNDNKDWAENGLSDFYNAITVNSGKTTVNEKNAAIIALEEAIATFKAANSVDMTSRITNPNFDSNIDGWTKDGGDGNAFQRQTSSQTNFTGGFLEKWRNGWNGSHNQKNFDVYQKLTNMPNGEYTVKAYILAQMQGNKETLGDNYKDKKHGGPYYIDNDKGVWFYAKSGETTANTWANSFTPTFGDASGGVLRSATVNVSNGELTIGFKGIGSDNGGNSLGTYANWIACDSWTLSYFGFDPTALQATLEGLKTQASGLLSNNDYTNVTGKERDALSTASALSPAATKSALESAISQAETAIADFTAAKTNYDALVAEITKAKALGIAEGTANGYAATAESTAATALTSTQNLKVAEYNYVKENYSHGVSLGEWTSTGTNTSAATFNNEHWSGEQREYKNQKDDWGNPKQGYAAANWSIDFSQDVTLPAGNYVFKVAGRQASGDKVNTSLVVKKGEEVLGTVSDFPRSNSSRGINKSGATSFDPEDEAGFANNGNGFGWEWRYVKFTLSTDATVNVAISSVATDYNQWVSFGDYTLQTDNEANISLIAYNIALNDAITAIANTDYANITGSEKTDLQDAIDADATLNKNDKDAINDAKTALEEKTTAFTAAKGAYDAYVAAKKANYNISLPYASLTKLAAFTTAKAAGDATSASDATNKTNAILSAYRIFVESNAMAEGVTGAVNKTSLIADPNFAGVTISGTTAGAWTFDQTGGDVNINSNESFTDGAGNSNYSYFDYYNGSNNNQNVHQVIENLEAGCYLLTATGRGHSNFNNNLQLYVVGKGSVKIPAIGNTGGTFDRGWNDATLMFSQTETSNITIGAKTDNGKAQWWGVTRFRLVKLPTVVINEDEEYTPAEQTAYLIFNRTLKAGWNGLVLPYNVSSSEMDALKLALGVTEDRVMDFSGITYDETNGVTLNFEPATEIVAGRPFMIYLANEKNSFTSPIPITLSANALQDVTKTVDGNPNIKYTFKGTYAATTDLTDVDFALIQGNTLYYHKAAEGLESSAKAFRAYFVNESTEPGAARISFNFGDGEVTGISEVKASAADSDAIYNLGGQRVMKAQKGLYIQNGKKVIIK